MESALIFVLTQQTPIPTFTQRGKWQDLGVRAFPKPSQSQTLAPARPTNTG